jgi:Ala-tRNA(Pro) deacylase
LANAKKRFHTKNPASSKERGNQQTTPFKARTYHIELYKEIIMPVKKLKDFLDKNKTKYVSIKHSPTYTAQEIAASAHIPGKELAKTVMVKLDGKLAMAVLPASFRVDLNRLKDAAGVSVVEIANEQDFKNLFPECELGAMPPFGNLYDMDVYVAQSLAEDEEIAFNAGSHTELIKLAYKDFEKLVAPKVVEFASLD